MNSMINNKYRALYLLTLFLILNFICNVYFAKNANVEYYLSSYCIFENGMKIIISVGIFFSMMLAGFDITNKFINKFKEAIKEESIDINASISEELYKEIKSQIEKETRKVK
ncbi:hypothetical protein ABRY17_15685 [Clostridioides difficile]|nr:hypothetical protein [Clostridioides difficile]